MRRSGAGLLAGLFLASLALRPQLVGVGPLLPSIQHDLDVPHAVAGLLVTILLACMGVFAPAAAFASRLLGSRIAIAASLAAIAIFGVLRGVVPGPAAVIALTLPVGIGVALAGTLMPVAVKESFPDRPAFATGVYSTAIILGAAVSAAIAVPVAHVAGGWRSALIAFSAFTGLLVIAWLVLTRGGPPHERAAVARPVRLPWRSGVAWGLVLLFTFTSVLYYGVSAWLPASYVERGWSEGTAGALLTVINVVSLPFSLLVAWHADRIPSRRAVLGAASLAMLGGLLGVVLVPAGGWAWAVVIGMGAGAIFPILMTLPLDVADGPAQVGAVAGMMLGGGYALASVAPFVLGAVRDGTGSFGTALWLLVAAAVVVLLLTSFLSGERLRRGVSRARPRPGCPDSG